MRARRRAVTLITPVFGPHISSDHSLCDEVHVFRLCEGTAFDGVKKVLLLSGFLLFHCAFLTVGTVNMMDRIATATMNTLNISAIIAAARTARLSCRP